MIGGNLQQVRQTISAACRKAGRSESSVLLLAVSKTKPASAIAEAYRAGQRHFGENYCQEALRKIAELGAYDITWHFIGPIQSNKTKLIAGHFSWVHSVDSLKVARRLSEQRPPELAPLNVCVQVNISSEASKSGVNLADLDELCAAIALMPQLKLRGVMAIPLPDTDFERQKRPYQEIRRAVVELGRPELRTLSFGMSGDLEAAIAEGATIVRIGTALFGAR